MITTRGHDRRTAGGREQEIIEHIRLNNGFVSMFWVDAIPARVAAWRRLKRAGEIIEDVLPRPPFPTWRYRITADARDHDNEGNVR